MEPPSVGSTTDEHGHSRPVSLYSTLRFPYIIALTYIDHFITRCRFTNYYTKFCLFLGCLHAVPCQWTIHYGGIGQQFPIHDRRPGLHNYGSDTCAGQSETQSNFIDINGFPIYFGFIFHHMGFYANEAAGLFATIEPFTLYSIIKQRNK